MSLSILQIVPRLPPQITGVGDYAYLLARELRSAHDIETRFLVYDQAPEGEQCLDGFPVARLGGPSEEELLARLTEAPQVVLLHYVGYGYAKRGCPFWLEKGLRRWRRADTKRRLVVMFHELFASGPFWRSSFWASHLQRGLAARLASIADHAITNMRRYAEWLTDREARHRQSLSALPVFSTVGEAPAPRALAERAPRMVIFGGAAWVREIYERHLAELLLCCRELRIEELVTIGSPVGTARACASMAVREYGFLRAEEVVRIISTSRAGFMDYFPGYLAKSSVYAAYAAHGLLTVLPHDNPSEADGCRAGATYLLPEQLETCSSEESLQQVADNARRWYHGHNLSNTAQAYARLFKECAVGC